MAAVNDQNPVILDTDDLVAWLESNEVAALTEAGDWPTPGTAAIWGAFRAEMLNRTSQRWTAQEWRRTSIRPPGRSIRFRLRPTGSRSTMPDNSVKVLTPDFKPVITLRRTMIDRVPSVLTARFEEGSTQAIIRRLGRSRASWPRQ